MHSENIFLIVDSRQIEARVLAWIAGQNDLVKEFAEGKSPYCTLATELFGEKVWKPSDEEKKTPAGKIMAVKYGFGKDGILGCGYGMGTNTFFQRCRENEDLRPMFDSGEYDWDFVDKLIKTYRKTYTKIPRLWTEMEKAFKWVTKYPHEVISFVGDYKLHFQKKEISKSITHSLLTFWNQNGTVHLQLPSGRVLTYRHCRVADRKIKWHWGTLWGGGIVENIVQSIARDLLGYWILEFEKSNLPVVLTAHDEIISLVPKSSAEKDLRLAITLMSQGPEWTRGLPLDAEGELSSVYKK